jgi:hemerythrin
MITRLAKELCVGFEEIDGQHRQLLRLLEEAAATVESGVAPLRDALAKLADFVAAHFGAEEQLMAETSYPDRGKHKTAHDLFLQDLAQLSKELDTFGVTPLVRHWIERRVPEWTRFHIQVNDLPLGGYLASRRHRPEAAPARDKPHAS